MNINLIKYNKQLIMNFCNDKKIIISNIEDIFDNIKIEIGEKSDFPYAYIDQDDPFKIIISEDIPMEDRYKWLNHELIHVISNNQSTINEINVGGIIIEDKEKNIWIGKYLNEAITEYINQQIINDKYSDYYDCYIKELEYIISIIGEDIILKAYFTNNLDLIINELNLKTSKSKEEILDFINSIDCAYENKNLIKL